MNNNIKITVEYETPKTDAFYSLLSEYGKIARLSDETISYYKPLADIAEETKIKTILKQLETIIDYLEQLHNMDQNICSVVAYCPTGSTNPMHRKFEIKYSSAYNFEIWWNGDEFSLERYKKYPSSFNNQSMDEYNILGNWDKWRVYEQLEQHCIRHLNTLIDRRKAQAEKQIKRLKNITEN